MKQGVSYVVVKEKINHNFERWEQVFDFITAQSEPYQVYRVETVLIATQSAPVAGTVDASGLNSDA